MSFSSVSASTNRLSVVVWWYRPTRQPRQWNGFVLQFSSSGKALRLFASFYRKGRWKKKTSDRVCSFGALYCCWWRADADTAADAAWLELLTLELVFLLLGRRRRSFVLPYSQSRTRCKWPAWHGWYNHQPTTSSSFFFFFFFVSTRVVFSSGPRYYFLLHYRMDTINRFFTSKLFFPFSFFVFQLHFKNPPCPSLRTTHWHQHWHPHTREKQPTKRREDTSGCDDFFKTLKLSFPILVAYFLWNITGYPLKKFVFCPIWI